MDWRRLGARRGRNGDSRPNYAADCTRTPIRDSTPCQSLDSPLHSAPYWRQHRRYGKRLRDSERTVAGTEPAQNWSPGAAFLICGVSTPGQTRRGDTEEAPIQ